MEVLKTSDLSDRENDEELLIQRVTGCRTHDDLGVERLVKIRDVVKMLEYDGSSVARQRGSHRPFKHATKPGLITVADKPGDDVAPGTLNSISKRAELKR